MGKSTRQPKLTLKTGTSGKTHLVLQGGNGETIMTSENYATKSNATRALNGIKGIVGKAQVSTTTSKTKKK